MTPAERVAESKPDKLPWGTRTLASRKVVFPKNRLKELRLGLNLTQAEVGAGAGVPSYAAVEMGFEVHLTTALKLAAFFGTTVEELFGTPAQE